MLSLVNMFIPSFSICFDWLYFDSWKYFVCLDINMRTNSWPLAILY